MSSAELYSTTPRLPRELLFPELLLLPPLPRLLSRASRPRALRTPRAPFRASPRPSSRPRRAVSAAGAIEGFALGLPAGLSSRALLRRRLHGRLRRFPRGPLPGRASPPRRFLRALLGAPRRLLRSLLRCRLRALARSTACGLLRRFLSSSPLVIPPLAGRAGGPIIQLPSCRIEMRGAFGSSPRPGAFGSRSCRSLALEPAGLAWRRFPGSCWRRPSTGRRTWERPGRPA